MKQIDYFKFLKLFPEIIDVDGSVDVKLFLLNEIKKRSKIQKEKTKLLPIIIGEKIIKVEDLRSKGIEDFYIKIMFKRIWLFSVLVLKYKSTMTNKTVVVKYVAIKQGNIKNACMPKEESINLKRVIMIDNMVK